MENSGQSKVFGWSIWLILSQHWLHQENASFKFLRVITCNEAVTTNPSQCVCCFYHSKILIFAALAFFTNSAEML